MGGEHGKYDSSPEGHDSAAWLHGRQSAETNRPGEKRDEKHVEHRPASDEIERVVKPGQARRMVGGGMAACDQEPAQSDEFQQRHEETGREHDRPKRRVEGRERWGVQPEETVALFAAMNYRLKGLEPLLRAVALLPSESPFRLLVAGGSDTAVFERLARRLKIAERVRFVGYCADMRNCYFAADFFVHPTFYDPCSLVVMEALACGLPVITTRYNGAAEVMHPPHRCSAW